MVATQCPPSRKAIKRKKICPKQLMMETEFWCIKEDGVIQLIIIKPPTLFPQYFMLSKEFVVLFVCGWPKYVVQLIYVYFFFIWLTGIGFVIVALTRLLYYHFYHSLSSVSSSTI